ncbi:hypothetical protein [Aquiflexum lacus]|uniref:hypothetical protein n=1 Tax=Aquiflexum lacus TaxID=2483805 RepID=UPI00189505D3|nr:hypothetical protein [Aquiflexum lacus]
MKIIQVLNSIIEKKEKISNVKPNGNAYFFLFDGEFKWAIERDNSGVYAVYFFPSNELLIDQFSNPLVWMEEDYVKYSTEELKSKEAFETFKDLYQVVIDKVFDIDKMFDKIISA